MSTNKTENYHLHAWEAGDDFLRSEINENFALLDGALFALDGRKAEIVVGSYVGDGQSTREISLGRTPRAVLVLNEEGRTGESSFTWGGLALPGHPVKRGSANAVEVKEGGFAVRESVGSYSGSCCNGTGDGYYYVAIF